MRRLKKKEQPTVKEKFITICRSLSTYNNDDGYRLEYNTLEEAYRKFLHTIWYYVSTNSKNDIVCAVYQNNRIVYNFSKVDGKCELVDCLDRSKTNPNVNVDYLSKLILTAIMQYEAMEHETKEN